MARKSKLETMGLAILGVIGLIVVGIQKFFEVFGYVLPSLILIGAIGYIFWNKSRREKQRIAALESREKYLLKKYEEVETVENIVNKTIWIGETAEQLQDSWGTPHDIDQKVLKTKKKEIWKYGYKGGNRYMYRITLDNDIVIGWDEKA